jgi:hypothetical protein
MKKIRQYALVTLTDEYFSENDSPSFRKLKGVMFIYLGEIPNMLGHCVVANSRTGKVDYGYHLEDFQEMKD